MKQLGKVFEDIKNRRTKSINDEDLLVVRGLEAPPTRRFVCNTNWSKSSAKSDVSPTASN